MVSSGPPSVPGWSPARIRHHPRGRHQSARRPCQQKRPDVVPRPSPNRRSWRICTWQEASTRRLLTCSNSNLTGPARYTASWRSAGDRALRRRSASWSGPGNRRGRWSRCRSPRPDVNDDSVAALSRLGQPSSSFGPLPRRSEVNPRDWTTISGILLWLNLI